MSIALAYQEILNQVDEMKALLEGCARNERGAQNKVYELFYPNMMSLVRRYYPDENVAVEILNNGFLRAFRKVGKFSYVGSFEGWLRKIMRNAVSDYARKHMSYTENIMLVGEDEELPYGPTINKEAADRLYYQQLLQLVKELPENERMVFNLYAIDGATHAEIAKILNINAGTSKWYLAEARKILKEKIELLDNQ